MPEQPHRENHEARAEVLAIPELARTFVRWPANYLRTKGWFRDPVVRFIALELVGHAQWKDGFLNGVHLRRGEVLTSISKLEFWTGYSSKQIRRALNTLRDSRFIIEDKASIRKCANKGTVYSIMEPEVFGLAEIKKPLMAEQRAESAGGLSRSNTYACGHSGGNDGIGEGRQSIDILKPEINTAASSGYIADERLSLRQLLMITESTYLEPREFIDHLQLIHDTSVEDELADERTKFIRQKGDLERLEEYQLHHSQHDLVMGFYALHLAANTEFQKKKNGDLRPITLAVLSSYLERKYSPSDAWDHLPEEPQDIERKTRVPDSEGLSLQKTHQSPDIEQERALHTPDDESPNSRTHGIRDILELIKRKGQTHRM